MSGLKAIPKALVISSKEQALNIDNFSRVMSGKEKSKTLPPLNELVEAAMMMYYA